MIARRAAGHPTPAPRPRPRPVPPCAQRPGAARSSARRHRGPERRGPAARRPLDLLGRGPVRPGRGPAGSPVPSRTVASDSGGSAPRARRGRPPRRPAPRPGGAADQPAAFAAARRSTSAAGGSRSSSAGQLPAAAATHVLDLGLGLGVALDRVGGELVDVGEDRLGEQAQLLGIEAGTPCRQPRSAARRLGRRPGRRPAGSRGCGPGAARRGRARRRPRARRRGRASGSRISATNWRRASSTPVRMPRPKLPSSGRAYSGTSTGDRREGLGGDRVELGLDQLGDPRPRGLATAHFQCIFVIYMIKLYP